MLFPSERTVINLVAEKAAEQPDALAVKDRSVAMTYLELATRSDLVAIDLLQRSIHPEEAVAIMFPASAEYVVAMLGILKAGGSYLPIDPDVPDKRREFLLKDSGSRFVLTNGNGNDALREWTGTVLEMERIVAGAPGGAGESISLANDPNRRAYIIYTSGSTGQPKGVEIEHHSLANLVGAYRESFALTSRDRSTMLSNVAFDASVAEVWPALCAGGSLMVPPRELLQHPDDLITWLAEEEITWSFVPTGMAELLFARAWPEQMPLRILVTGGDRLRVRPPQELPFTVFNAYGPTENTVISTWSPLKGQSSGLPPIGHPIANVKAYVLGEHRKPVEEGTPGELYLGGEQVARGYLGKPGLTAERFSPDPFAGRPGDRMYRTGDWVRRLPDGQLDFLGRQDEQVQIRGSRVELGEVENILISHPAVRQVCCLPRLEEGVATGIVAHIVSEEDGTDFLSELRTHLGRTLPGYMQPSQFLFHELLPLTSYGKVDRKALANSDLIKVEQTRIDAAGDELELSLWGLWHSLLPEADNSPLNTTFSSLGGDSLLLVKMMLGVEEIAGRRLETSTFLMRPTFPGLCQAVKMKMSETEFQTVLALRKEGSRPPLFCLYNYEGDIDVYFGLAEKLGDDQPVFGIRSLGLEDLSHLPVSIEAAGAEIVECIRKVLPKGIPALLGYSWAGLLAFEVARQLADKERISCFAGLIGTDAPMRPTNVSSRLTHFFKVFPHWFWNLIADREKRWERLSQWRTMISRTKKNLATAHLPMKDWVSDPISTHLVALMEKYRPLPESEVTVDLFRERETYQNELHPLQAWRTSNLPDGGWNRWTRKATRIHWLSGEHSTILKAPAVSGLAQAIRQAMDQHAFQELG